MFVYGSYINGRPASHLYDEFGVQLRELLALLQGFPPKKDASLFKLKLIFSNYFNWLSFFQINFLKNGVFFGKPCRSQPRANLSKLCWSKTHQSVCVQVYCDIILSEQRDGEINIYTGQYCEKEKFMEDMIFIYKWFISLSTSNPSTVQILRIHTIYDPTTLF